MWLTRSQRTKYDVLFSHRVIFASWTAPDVLAVWYSLGLLCFRVSTDAIQCSDSQSRLKYYDAGVREALRRWHMPEATKASLDRASSADHDELIATYYSTISNPELSRLFFVSIVEKIIGSAPESDGNSAADRTETAPLNCAGPSPHENVSRLFAEVLDEARQVFGAPRTSTKGRLLHPGEKAPTVLSVRISRRGGIIREVSSERSMIIMRAGAQ